MPNFKIQIDGETVAEFGGEVNFVEVKSSMGLLGEMHPSGQSRINVVTHKNQEFSTNLEDISPVPPAREPQPVEDEETQEVPVEKEPTGFKFPVE